MAEFVAWDGASGGGMGGGGGDTDELEAFIPPPNQKDAVLFAVDCRSFMFSHREQQATTITDDGRPTFIPTKGGCAFSQAVRSSLQFYQDKVASSERDYSGLLLFGCQGARNSFGFPNIFVFQDLDLPSAPRVKELEKLARCGELNEHGVKYDDSNAFFREVGHFDAAAGSAKPEPGRPLPLSEVLWAAQHMFRNLPKAVSTKKIMLFTLDDNPPAESQVERDKCIARVHDLFEAGVGIEVFPNLPAAPPTASAVHMSSSGMDTIGRTTATSAVVMSSGLLPASGVPPTTTTPMTTTTGSSSITSSSAHVESFGPSSAASHTSAKMKVAFDKTKFWDPIFNNGTSFMDDLDASNGRVLLAQAGEDDPFTSLLETVRARSWPKRTNGILNMQIGVGGNSPKIKVGVYLPIMKCKKPPFVWLEGTTNAQVSSTVKNIDPDTGDEVAPTDILVEGKIGGTTVKFQPDEMKSMKAQFGPPGMTILAFKDASCLKAKYSVNRTAFIAPQLGDRNEDKLFKGLHQTLVTQNKVAIAQLVARTGAAPRLVALIPSHNKPEVAEAVSGTGFHVFYLPYADDIRSLKFDDPFHFTKEARDKTMVVIDKLTIKAGFHPNNFTNPVLERQYHHLQTLALQGEDDGDRTMPPDSTLPDTVGMSKYSAEMAAFTSEVYPEGYNPDLAIAAASKAKPPPTADELNAYDFDHLEKNDMIGTLTVPVLKAFLKLNGESTAGLKADVVARVAHTVRRQRDSKRPREDDDLAV